MFSYRLGSLVFPWLASSRSGSLSYSEAKRGYRTLGGDQGDLHFGGYDTDSDGTELTDVVLSTSHEGLSDEEARQIAESIVSEAYDSIGAECVEHS